MTAPRRLPEDQTHVVSRRTHARTFFLVPTEETVQIVFYALLLSASRHHERSRLQTSAFCFLSNHYHALPYDPKGGPASGLPGFMADLNTLIARAMNAKLDRGGHFWSQGSYSNVEVHGFEAEIAQYCYVMAQPVAAGLVERPEEWPGLPWGPEDHGKTITIERPKQAFFGAISRLKGDPQRQELLARMDVEERKKRRTQGEDDKARNRSRKRRRRLAKARERRAAKRRAAIADARITPQRSTLPDQVSYTIPFPRCLEGWDPDEARRYLRMRLDAHVAAIHDQRKAERLGYMGLRKALSVSTSATAGDDCPTFGRNPCVSAGGLSLGKQLAILDDLVQFRGEHGEGVTQLERTDAPWRARFPKGANKRAKELRRVLQALAQPPPRRA